VQDIKTLLAMTVTDIDIRRAYQKFDGLHLTKEAKTASGERAYQVSSGAAHRPMDFLAKLHSSILALGSHDLAARYAQK
jgi:hypothetical protein